jgi:homocysteine S-methyltransferase
MSLFLERLQQNEPLVLDGATGTEINRRGIETTLPLWSAGALQTHPDVVRDIHTDYLRAGADIITTNTFRTHAHNLESTEEARQMTLLAVQLAQEAIAELGRTAFIAGSIAPLEDCYSPELTPSEIYCQREHARMVKNLADASVDFLLIETMHTIHETKAAAKAAYEAEIPFVVSFILNNVGQLLSGESLQKAVREIMPFEPAAFMVNCIPVKQIVPALRALQELTNLPIGAYGNMGIVDESSGWAIDEDLTPAHYCHRVEAWLDLGAKIIGSCCGSNPEHTQALRELVDNISYRGEV